jgi:hypothetical protein
VVSDFQSLSSDIVFRFLWRAGLRRAKSRSKLGVAKKCGRRLGGLARFGGGDAAAGVDGQQATIRVLSD